LGLDAEHGKLVSVFDRAEPCSANGYQAEHAALIAHDYARLTRRFLVGTNPNPAGFAEALYDAPFVVLAHDCAPDPVFFYANRAAQTLFEMNWSEITALPSRLSAEPLAQAARHDLLERVLRAGFIDNYEGVRIAKSGRRFHITQATVWNLHKDERRIGQAATFANWTLI
jgi:hypothetical protein